MQRQLNLMDSTMDQFIHLFSASLNQTVPVQLPVQPGPVQPLQAIQRQQHVHVQPIETDCENVPPEHQIPQDTLNLLYRGSTSVGNFAKKLTERLFPELFGADNWRIRYSYSGGNHCGQTKVELDHVRKAVLRQYILHVRPEYQVPSMWNDVVNAINEGLRRPIERTRKTAQ